MLFRIFMTMRYGILLLLITTASCSVHRSAEIGWQGHNVRLQVTPPGGGGLFSYPTIECLTCDEVIPPVAVSLDSRGRTEFSFTEAQFRIAHRFRFRGAGIDTALILQPHPPEEAMRLFHPALPLIGRILAVDYLLLYEGDDMKSVVGVMERGDEANLAGETDLFYLVYHPKHSAPVYVLKTSAVRIQ